MEQILDGINEAVKGAFPNSISKYKSVHALLLSWKDGEFDGEVKELKTLLETGYGYRAERYEIPLDEPDFELTSRLQKFRSEYKKKKEGDCLFIIYYAGHGYLDRKRRSMWSCRAPSSEDPEPPRVKWYAHEALFTETIHDTLFLFDCCTAGSSSETTRIGIKEVIAACGFETWAPGDREHSFTKALITVLESLVRAGPFTVANLHQQILEKLQHWSPQLEPNQFLEIGLDGRLSDIERRRTPVHIALNQDPYYYHSSIQLVGQFAGAANSYRRPEESFAQWKDEKKEHTDVIISIRVQGKLDVVQIARWIKRAPLLAMSVKVHCVVHKDPTLVLLALPVAVWDLLPTNTPCQFIGYANSPNLIFGKEYLFLPRFGTSRYPPSDFLAIEQYVKTNAAQPDMPRLQEWFYDDYFRKLSETEPDSPHVKYAANMQRFHIGHALLEPESPETVRPGACGYLRGGKWHPIKLPDMPPSSPGAPVQLSPSPRGGGSFQWSSYRRGDSEFDPESYHYRLGDGWGAILLPSRPVTYENIETDELLIWAHSNAQSILTGYPDVKQCGFYLISGTYATKDFGIITRDAPAGGSFVVKQDKQSNNNLSRSFTGDGGDSGFVDARQSVQGNLQSNNNLSWVFTGCDGDSNTKRKEYQEEAIISFQGFHFTYKKILSQRPTAPIVEEQSAADEYKSLHEFQYTPFVWPGDLGQEWRACRY